MSRPHLGSQGAWLEKTWKNDDNWSDVWNLWSEIYEIWRKCRGQPISNDEVALVVSCHWVLENVGGPSKRTTIKNDWNLTDSTKSKIVKGHIHIYSTFIHLVSWLITLDQFPWTQAERLEDSRPFWPRRRSLGARLVDRWRLIVWSLNPSG